MLPTQIMHSAASSSSSSKAAPPATDDVADSALLELEKGRKNPPSAAGRERRRAVVAAAIVDVCLAAAALAGAAVLTWWAVAFHPSYAHLWMVPVGLVLACTPVVVCAALHFSSSSGADTRAPRKGGAGASPPLSAVVVGK